jgi:hypothetical protein
VTRICPVGSGVPRAGELLDHSQVPDEALGQLPEDVEMRCLEPVIRFGDEPDHAVAAPVAQRGDRQGHLAPHAPAADEDARVDELRICRRLPDELRELVG